MRRRTLLLLCLSAAAVGVAAERPLKPEAARRLPAAIGQQARDVAWLDDEHVLVASERDVSRFAFKSREVTEVLAATPVPDCLSEPMSIATDGATLVAVSAYSS